jgi:hypothetical protein
VLGSLIAPYATLWLPAHRAPWAVLFALLSLPYFAAFELWLRASTGAWVPVVGRVLSLAVMIAAAVLQLLPPFLLLAVGGFALFFALFELLGFRAARAAPNPWFLALYQAMWSGVLNAALFPMVA